MIPLARNGFRRNFIVKSTVATLYSSFRKRGVTPQRESFLTLFTKYFPRSTLGKHIMKRG